MIYAEDPRQTLADKVYGVLESDILSGRYRAGELLSENGISQETGASRTPVREALRRLEAEGLAYTMPNRGIAVKPVSQEDARDIYEIRMRVEGLAARRAAGNADEGSITRLRETVELQDFYAGRSDAEQMKILDTRFHEEIYQLSGSEYLTQLLRDMHRRIQRYRKLSISCPDRTGKIAREHREILDAIAAHDPDLAESRMVAHIQAAAENLTKIILDSPACGDEMPPAGTQTRGVC